MGVATVFGGAPPGFVPDFDDPAPETCLPDRLPLGIGRRIDAGAELRVHTGPGETDEEAVFVGLDAEVRDDESSRVVLLDAAGTEVATSEYPPST